MAKTDIKPQETEVQSAAGDQARVDLSPVDPRSKTLQVGRTWPTQDGFLFYENGGTPTVEQRFMMLRDPQVRAALRIRRASVVIDGVQVNPVKVERGDTKRADRARYWADFVRWNLAQPSVDVYGTLLQLEEADWWRNMAADVLFREERRGAYKGMICLDEMPVFGPDDYIIWRDLSGRFIGLQSRHNPKDEDGADVVYPAEKYLFNVFSPGRGHRDGDTLADVVWTPFYKKNQAHPEQMANMAQFSSPTVIATGPGNKNGTPLQPVTLLSHERDQWGRQKPLLDANGQKVEVLPQEAMAHGLAGYQAGGFYLIPYSAEMKLLEAQGDGRNFISLIDGEDWQIMVGILGTGNMTGRAKYGSNASAETGASAVEIMSSPEKRAAGNRLTQLAKTLVRLNAPDEEDLAPVITCGDPQRPFVESLFKSVMANSPFADEQFLTDLANRIGVTPPDFQRLREEGPLLGTVPPSGGVGGNPNEVNS